MGKETVSRKGREAQLYPKSSGNNATNEDQIVASEAFEWHYSADKKTIYVTMTDGYVFALNASELTIDGDSIATYLASLAGEELPLASIIWWDKSLEAVSKTNKSSGTADTDTATCLEDSTATFQTDGVVAGDIVWNTTDSVPATVVSVDSEIKITLDYDAFPDGNEDYDIYDEPDVQPGWVEMDGGTIDEPNSPFDGMGIVDVIGEERFIRARQTAGRLQADAIRNIEGSFQGNDGFFYNMTGAFEPIGGTSTGPAGSGNSRYVTVGFDASNVVPTADENRPINISAIPIIKIMNSTSVKLATYYSVDGDNFADLAHLSDLADDDRLVVWDESTETYQYTEIDDIHEHFIKKTEIGVFQHTNNGNALSPCGLNVWCTTPLNTEQYNGITGASSDMVTNHDVTLPAGTYEIDFSHVFMRSGVVRARVYDVTNSAVIVGPIGGFADSGSDGDQVAYPCCAIVILTGETTIRLEHQYNTSSSYEIGYGIGEEAVYSWLKVRRIA